MGADENYKQSQARFLNSLATTCTESEIPEVIEILWEAGLAVAADAWVSLARRMEDTKLTVPRRDRLMVAAKVAQIARQSPEETKESPGERSIGE